MISKTDIIQTEQIIRLHSGHFDVDLFRLRDNATQFITKYWLNSLLLGLLLYVVFTKDIHFSVHLNEDGQVPIAKALVQPVNLKQKNAPQNRAVAAQLPMQNEEDHNGDGIIELLPARPMKTVKSVAPLTPASASNAANMFDNVSIFENPAKVDPSVVKTKKDKCQDYIARFVNVARAERSQFGIPVSITLAQGLLESDAGESRLTRAANNHFGIKSFNKKMPYVVMKDDTPTDKFRKYGTAWESYRDHSKLLVRDHFKHLQYLSKTDYAGWAKGLQKAGYATDKRYADKLVKIIENLQLYKFDEI